MSNNSPFLNHLVGEKSPYLHQHVSNPVDWYPWHATAFEKARREDKPILLSIGYSTCHWCHVMAHESFENEEIAKIINDHFVAIKVDREERPDIDHIYMMATTAMTGQGGWPLTVFLTADGDPFYGGTYFPPYAKWGSVGFIDLLNSIATGWKNDRENVAASARSMTENLKRHAQRDSDGEVLDDTVLDRSFRQMKGQFDQTHGGFGSAPKFPMGHNLSFLLRFYRQRKDPQALQMVEKTLLAMAHGGIWDHLGGGFHRYSTDQNWHVPHFEKMLYDQALLSRAYLEAYQLTGHRQFAQTARELLDYVQREMTESQGGFYSAQDADSADEISGHIKEGAYYTFTKDEIDTCLKGEDAAIFNYCYGILADGNASFDPHGEFINENILYLAHSFEEAAVEFHRQNNEIQAILKEGFIQLLALRQKRPRPHRDEKVLCDWNGLMLGSFAFASCVLGEPKYAKTSIKAADFVLGNMVKEGQLYHRWKDQEAGIKATLEDYAFLIYGLLDVYEACFNDKYLKQAGHLADKMINLFADPKGGYYMTAIDAENLIIRPKEVYDGALPSGNSVAAFVLLKLYALTGNENYLTQAEGLFKCFAPQINQTPYAHNFLLSALNWYHGSCLEITFEGDEGDRTVAQMIKVLHKYFIPNKVIKWHRTSGLALAHICYQGTCLKPLDTVEAFEREIIERA